MCSLLRNVLSCPLPSFVLVVSPEFVFPSLKGGHLFSCGFSNHVRTFLDPLSHRPLCTPPDQTPGQHPKRVQSLSLWIVSLEDNVFLILRPLYFFITFKLFLTYFTPDDQDPW